MAKKININLQNVPPAAKIAIAIGVPVLVIVLSYFFAFKPLRAQIASLTVEIAGQQKEIEKNEAKAAHLPELKKKYAELEVALKILSTQLPEEKEVSNLLKQVSDYGTKSGLTVTLWKPAAKKSHPSGIVWEIPVDIKMTGAYNNLGAFYSKISGMSRIINISDITLKKASGKDSQSKLDIVFVAQTFSAIPESELKGAAADAKGGKK